MAKYRWETQKIELEFFGPHEFDHPDLMDGSFLQDCELVRMRCGFPIEVTDDARSKEEHELLYAREISKGEHYPTESAHLVVEEILVRCIDWKPAIPRANDGCDLTLDQREIRLTYEITRMEIEGRWKHLGLIIETGHWHTDDTPRLGARRPMFSVGVSR